MLYKKSTLIIAERDVDFLYNDEVFPLIDLRNLDESKIEEELIKYLYNYIVQNPFQFDIIHYCFNKYTNYQTFIILPLFYIPQKSVELSHTL